MKRRITFSLFVLFVLAALAPLANAQVCPPWVDQVSCLQEDAHSIIRNARLRGLRERAISQAIHGYGYGEGYGYPGIGGYPVGADSGRVGRDIGAGLLGASVGGAFGGRRGALIGGAVGVGAAELGGYFASRSAARRERPLDCSKRKLNRNEQETCSAIVAEQQAFAREQAAQAELAERQRTGKKYYNRTGFPGDILDGDQLVANLRPNQSIILPEAREGYRMEMLVPDRSTPGRTERLEAHFRVACDFSGWVFSLYPVKEECNG